MFQIMKVVVQYIAYFAEAIAAFIIVLGILKALLVYVKRCFLLDHECRITTRTRLNLGHSLSLALEILIGADIIKTAIAPTWSDIGQLAAIIAIRIVLNFFLIKELEYEGKTLSNEETEKGQK